MSMYEIIATALIAGSLGIFAGHAAGYGRAMDVMKRRGAALPRYRHVGRPE